MARSLSHGHTTLITPAKGIQWLHLLLLLHHLPDLEIHLWCMDQQESWLTPAKPRPWLYHIVSTTTEPLTYGQPRPHIAKHDQLGNPGHCSQPTNCPSPPMDRNSYTPHPNHLAAAQQRAVLHTWDIWSFFPAINIYHRHNYKPL